MSLSWGLIFEPKQKTQGPLITLLWTTSERNTKEKGLPNLAPTARWDLKRGQQRTVASERAGRNRLPNTVRWRLYSTF